MGLLSGMRKRRQEKKAIQKAAKVRAKAQVKADSKLEKRKEAYLRKTAKQVRKMDAKELKAQRKHNEKMAKASLEQIKAGRFNSKRVLRVVGAARVAAPFAIPLFYRSVTMLQEASNDAAARRMGLTPKANAQFPGDGGMQQARIKKIRQSLDKSVPGGFAKDISDRLDDLDKAIENSKSMDTGPGKRVLRSVSNELDLVETQLKAKKK
ncbi:DUF6474 family protein [uncultured Corynebacterium sp.]|uniref:DUF6474 family protein n=1 Tax=uncultured Corynebacterium sp. TaxID=159447 RepID=UPI0025EF1E0A|nr:DUF6474 family protein [uncultured Corynebacterium sp.]